MPLSAGDKLGPYEILAPIGAGGMGEVYRAHDSRLRRDVAIKVSAERFSERFEKEARAIASLNHPNVCTLHDVGPNYLVMELVEGETLADRIKQGAIPLDEALAIAKQIVGALEAAHEKGITHRDLKPGNIILKPDGTVKVLDFGLAKMGGTPTAQSEHSPTLTIGATQAGVILGTAAYMAPEQARGREVDRRADIWAFGVVLYEMVTGQKLFKGEDLSDTLASVIKEQPRLDRVPAKVQRLLRSCLEKDPKQRLQAIGDWRLLLEEPTAPVDTANPSRSRLGLATGIAAGLFLLTTLGVSFVHFREHPADRPLVRLDVDLGADVSLLPLTAARSALGSSVAISPDGMRLVYASGTPTKLFTRRLDQSKATELPGTQGASAPFFSPDGQWIGFAAGDRLAKISVEGGAVVPLGDVGIIFESSWGEDGSIFLSALGKGLMRLREGGGAPETIAALGNGEIRFSFPQLLPGGKAVLFAAYTNFNADAASIEVMTLADYHRKTVSRGGSFPRYLATSNGAGYLVYLNKATVFAVPFDLDKLETRGTALPILDDVASSGVLGTAQLSFSRTGTLVYRKGGGDSGLFTVAWLDSSGKTQPLLAKPGIYGRPSLSPDGQRLALEVAEGPGTDIWVYDPKRNTMTRSSFTGAAMGPVWSPDGRYIAFRTVGAGTSVIRSDGAGKAQPLTQSNNIQFPWSFTPDGKRMSLIELDSKTSYDLWTVPIESDGAGLRAGKPEVFLQTPADERSPALSPDGRWLAYSSNESGTSQIYVRAFPDKGGKWQISNGGGAYPMWSRAGHDLFFETLDNHIMAAAYTVQGDSFVADKVRMWSEQQLGGAVGSVRNIDLAPDGKRIVALMPATESKGAQEAQNHVVFIENFFDELRRKVPTGK
jgi:serine/threonine protein kinase